MPSTITTESPSQASRLQACNLEDAPSLSAALRLQKEALGFAPVLYTIALAGWMALA